MVTVVFMSTDLHLTTYRHLGYERVYLPLYKVADTSFHIQGDGITIIIFNAVIVSYLNTECTWMVTKLKRYY